MLGSFHRRRRMQMSFTQALRAMAAFVIATSALTACVLTDR